MSTAISSAIDRPGRFGVRFAGLIAGFAVGQGALFIVQSWLVATGELQVVASTGVAIAALSLLQWIADWGGLVILARIALYDGSAQAIWAANSARLVVALPVTAAAIIFARLYEHSDPFASGMLLGGSAVPVVWAVNISGFLDGRAKTAQSGPLAGLPPAFAATAIVFAVLSAGPSFGAGVIIGLLYTLGCLLCVGFQYALIEGIGRPVLDGASIRQYLREGAIYCGGELPNQLYGRALILVVTGALGAQVGGVYVYIRQILSGAAQIIGLLKRVEITRLGAILCGAEFRWGQFFGAQAVNLAASVGVCLTAIIAFSLRKWLPGRFGEVAFYFAFFSAVLPVWALSASLGQALILQRQVETYSRIILLTLGLAAIATVSFTATFGLLFVAVCDVTMNLLQIALFAHSARRPA